MTDTKKKWAFLALCLGFFMVILDVTIVNVALPTIADYFQTTLPNLQWIVDGYTLTFAGFLLLIGSLSDYFGPKKIFQLGLLAFSLTSLACALANSIAALIFFRLLQGVSGALLLPSSLALITQLYTEPEKKVQAIGIWAALGGIACASGPFLGGLLTSLFSWRMIFLVNVLIGLAAFFLIAGNMRHYKPSANPIYFDLFGQITGFIAIISLAFVLIEVSNYSWNNPLIIFSLLFSILSTLLFLWIEHHAKHPMLPLTLFQNKVTTMAIIAGLTLNLVFYGQLFMLPFYFENIRHYSVFMTGVAILPLPGLALIGSYLGGKLTAKMGAAKVISTGFFIAALGFFALLPIEKTIPNYLWIMIPFLAIGFGVSFTTPAMTFAAINSAGDHQTGIAAAVLNTGNQVGSLIGVAVFGTIAAIHKDFISAIHVTLFIAGMLFTLTAFLTLLLMEIKPIKCSHR